MTLEEYDRRMKMVNDIEEAASVLMCRADNLQRDTEKKAGIVYEAEEHIPSMRWTAGDGKYFDTPREALKSALEGESANTKENATL